jgi:GNAT superfamily N-acetyltransferase
MDFNIRPAVPADQPAIAALIAASVRGLSRADYDPRQIELSIQSVFGVDTELIADGTYFVAEAARALVGCGGWSRRRTLYGASVYGASRDSNWLDPQTEAAKIRAFFIHPDWARRGIGSAILEACERAAPSRDE